MILQFLVTVEIPAEPPVDRVAFLRDEIEEHAKAIVPFYTHQHPTKVTCIAPLEPVTEGR